MKNYKYELMKGSKHIVCPSCGKKTFKPFVLASDGKTIVDAERFGRCERVNSCGYFRYPGGDDKYDYDYTAPTRQPQQKIVPDFIPEEFVEKTFCRFKENVFFMYLVEMFGINEAYRLQELYNIGTAKNGGTIFWQQDKEGNFRTGKVMYYNKDGHRKKDKTSWYIHNKVKDNFVLQQVFFGEHLVTEEKPIALCESEKTAIMMSVFRPEFVWIATGGSEMLNDYRLDRLPRLDFVFPDNGQFKKWQGKTERYEGRQIDTSVDQAVKEGRLKEGDDILDLELLEIKFEMYRESVIKYA